MSEEISLDSSAIKYRIYLVLFRQFPYAVDVFLNQIPSECQQLLHLQINSL